ncbi:MAG: class I SAM-dependent methyltransferase [Chloroflexota bacterium]
MSASQPGDQERSIAFDGAAGFYDETRGFPPGEERAVAGLFVCAGALTPASRVLEIGVGTGRIALPLAAHVGFYTGIDLARPMMDRLRAKQPGEPVALIQGDMTRLPLKSAAFDAVVAVHIFHLVPGWRAALAEVARALRPGGLLLVGRTDGDRTPGEAILWAAWESVVPRQRMAPVGVSRDRIGDFPQGEGWQPAGQPLVHRYLVTRRLRHFFDRLEQRTFSSSWRLSDDEIARGIGAARAAADAHKLALDAPFEHEQRFILQAYQPPQR